MLEAIRNRAQSWIAKLILALILIPFALWGIDSYFSGGGRTETLAEVGDARITQQDFALALKEQAAAMRQAMGPNFDPAVLETKSFRQQVMARLTEEEAMLQAAAAAGLRVSDEQIALILHQLPLFQEGGKFSMDRYKQEVTRRGYSPAEFQERLKRDVTLQIQQQPVITGTLVAATSVDLVTRLAGQRREVAVADLSPASFASQVTVSTEEIQRYYDSHRADYADPEAVQVEYVVLSLDDLARSVTVTDKQVEDYFAANLAQFGPPEQRAASHILIAAPEGDANARKQARAKAEALLAAIRKAPASFAEVARRESQDPGSAAAGGSLGTFGRGTMVKPFEDAVFAMKPGEISNLVETQFGFHIIRLDQVHASRPSLAAVRAQVEDQVRRKEAQKQFADAAEQFSNLVYEQGSSLAPAAAALKLTLQTSPWLTRKGLAERPFNSPKLMEAIFSAEVIKSQQNIEPVEIERNLLVAARVIAHRPATPKPLADVTAQIREKLMLQKIGGLAEKQGQAMIENLKSGQEPSGITWSAFKIVGRQQPGEFDPKTLQAIMRAGRSGLPDYVGMARQDGGYRVIRISRIIEPAAPDATLRAAVDSGLHQAYARADAQAQVELAKAAQRVEIREGALDRKE